MPSVAHRCDVQPIFFQFLLALRMQLSSSMLLDSSEGLTSAVFYVASVIKGIRVRDSIIRYRTLQHRKLISVCRQVRQ